MRFLRPTGAIGAPRAWTGRQLLARDDWSRNVPDDVRDALERAAETIEATPGRWPELTAEQVRIPELVALATEIRRTLLDGLGFVVLRGLPVESWPVARAAAAFWILGLHVGIPVVQNGRGHLLGHVTDVGLHSDDPNVRIYQTNERQGFHTDSADVVGLLCLHPAQRGGRSALVSAAALHDAMLTRHPDLLPALFEPVSTDHRGEEPPGAPPFFRIPVLSWFAERLLVCYHRRYVDSAGRFVDAPPPTQRQLEALDAMDAMLEEPDLRLEMDLRPGDIQLIHNHALLHDRTAFEDAPDGPRRHLLRLWLTAPGGWALPPWFAERYGDRSSGTRGGLRVPPSRLCTPLAP